MKNIQVLVKHESLWKVLQTLALEKGWELSEHNQTYTPNGNYQAFFLVGERVNELKVKYGTFGIAGNHSSIGEAFERQTIEEVLEVLSKPLDKTPEAITVKLNSLYSAKVTAEFVEVVNGEKNTEKFKFSIDTIRGLYDAALKNKIASKPKDFGEYRIRCFNPQKHAAVHAALVALGFTPYSSETKDSTDWPSFSVNLGSKTFCGHSGKTPDKSDITLEILFDLLDLKPNIVVYKISDRWDVVIYPDRVSVGCQTFPISVIEDLLKAVDTVTKKG